MVFANDLELFIGRFKATLPHPILDRTFGQKGNVLPFFRFANAPPPPFPLRRECWKFAHERLQPLKVFGSAYAIAQLHFFHNILKGISIIYTDNKLHNYSKCKNFRQVLLQRAGEILTDFPFAFQARELKFIFLIDRFFFLCYLLKFFLQKQNK